jgi:hypothetical protein
VTRNGDGSLTIRTIGGPIPGAARIYNGDTVMRCYEGGEYRLEKVLLRNHWVDRLVWYPDEV